MAEASDEIDYFRSPEDFIQYHAEKLGFSVGFKPNPQRYHITLTEQMLTVIKDGGLGGFSKEYIAEQEQRKEEQRKRYAVQAGTSEPCTLSDG